MADVRCVALTSFHYEERTSAVRFKGNSLHVRSGLPVALQHFRAPPSLRFHGSSDARTVDGFMYQGNAANSLVSPAKAGVLSPIERYVSWPGYFSRRVTPQGAGCEKNVWPCACSRDKCERISQHFVGFLCI